MNIYHYKKWAFEVFQNISCLRLIIKDKSNDIYDAIFQNISCLRLILFTSIVGIPKNIFQNISCLG